MITKSAVYFLKTAHLMCKQTQTVRPLATANSTFNVIASNFESNYNSVKSVTTDLTITSTGACLT